MNNKFSKEYANLNVRTKRKGFIIVFLGREKLKEIKTRMRELTNFYETISLESILNSLHCDSWTMNNLLPMTTLANSISLAKRPVRNKTSGFNNHSRILPSSFPQKGSTSIIADK